MGVLSQNMDAVFSLEVLIGILADIYKKCFNYHSEPTEIESSQYHLLFSIIKHAGFRMLRTSPLPVAVQYS